MRPAYTDTLLTIICFTAILTGCSSTSGDEPALADAAASEDVGSSTAQDAGVDPVDAGSSDAAADAGPADTGAADAGFAGPTFTGDIFPLFAANGCTTTECHGSLFAEGGFAVILSDPALAFLDLIDRPSIRVAESIVEPGNPEQSVLFTHGRDENIPMGDLDAAGLALIEQWIVDGAPLGEAPLPLPTPQPPTCSYVDTNGWVRLPNACLPRCSIATRDAVAACQTVECQNAALDSDPSPPVPLDFGPRQDPLDCRFCVTQQTNVCSLEACPEQTLALIRCEGVVGGPCQAEAAQLSECFESEPAFDLCRQQIIPLCFRQ